MSGIKLVCDSRKHKGRVATLAHATSSTDGTFDFHQEAETFTFTGRISRSALNTTVMKIGTSNGEWVNWTEAADEGHYFPNFVHRKWEFVCPLCWASVEVTVQRMEEIVSKASAGGAPSIPIRYLT